MNFVGESCLLFDVWTTRVLMVLQPDFRSNFIPHIYLVNYIGISFKQLKLSDTLDWWSIMNINSWCFSIMLLNGPLNFGHCVMLWYKHCIIITLCVCFCTFLHCRSLSSDLQDPNTRFKEQQVFLLFGKRRRNAETRRRRKGIPVKGSSSSRFQSMRWTHTSYHDFSCRFFSMQEKTTTKLKEIKRNFLHLQDRSMYERRGGRDHHIVIRSRSLRWRFHSEWLPNIFKSRRRIVFIEQKDGSENKRSEGFTWISKKLLPSFAHDYSQRFPTTTVILSLSFEHLNEKE
jgi:hypothetical protein